MGKMLYDKNIQGECEKARVLWISILIVMTVGIVFLGALLVDVKNACQYVLVKNKK